MDEILDRLLLKKDEKYADFMSALVPYTPRESIIGVRSPELRKMAKELVKCCSERDFLLSLPHSFHDENVLHAMIVANEKKDIDKAIFDVEAFLPYVENWAVCDILVPRAFADHPEKVYKKIKEWLESTHTYTVRFALVVLLSNFLDENFSPDILRLVSGIKSEEYYVNMAIAWFYSYAFIKQYEATLPYFEGRRLGAWVHNKSIVKACESYRVPTERKIYLRTLKV